MQWKLGQIKSTLGKEPSTTLPTFKSGPTGPVTRTKESKTLLQVFQLMLTYQYYFRFNCDSNEVIC